MKLEEMEVSTKSQASRAKKGVRMVRDIVLNHTWKFPYARPAGSL